MVRDSADETRERHARELNNLRAAGDWAIAAEHDGETAVALAADSTEIWLSTGLIHEGLQRWQRAQPCVARAAPAVQVAVLARGHGLLSAGGAMDARPANVRSGWRASCATTAGCTSRSRSPPVMRRIAATSRRRAPRSAELDSIEHADWPLSLRVYGLEARRANQLHDRSLRGNTGRRTPDGGDLSTRAATRAASS